MTLNKEQLLRYSRNILIDEIGLSGQIKLKKAKVLVIGAGGLGTPVLTYLAGAGIGTLGLIDNDTVHLSNLNRQTIHSTSTLDYPKTESAKQFIENLNPDIKLDLYQGRIDISNVIEYLTPYDCIVDCLDTVELKFLLNDACVELGKPFFHGGILTLNGQIATILPTKAGCLRCLFPILPRHEDLPTSSQVGILGACAGVVGSLLAMEVIKYILGLPTLENHIMSYNGKSGSFKKLSLKQNDDCPVCSSRKMLPIEEYEATKYCSD